MIDINLVLDTILPGNQGMGLPPASAIEFAGYQERNAIGAQVINFLIVLDDTSRKRTGQGFVELENNERLVAINACKLSDVRLFTAFVTHVLRAYYTDPQVLSRIGAGAVPPFPDGNSLNSDDWTILEAVYLRGRIYRQVSAVDRVYDENGEKNL